MALSVIIMIFKMFSTFLNQLISYKENNMLKLLGTSEKDANNKRMALTFIVAWQTGPRD